MQVQRGGNTTGDERVRDQRAGLNALSFCTRAGVLIRDLWGAARGRGATKKVRSSPGDGTAPDKSKSL